MRAVLLLLLLVPVTQLARSQGHLDCPFGFQDVSEHVGIVFNPQDKTTGPTVGDLNQDGYLDIVQCNHVRFPIEVYYGSPNGSFTRELAFKTKMDRHGTATGDIDGNGKLDILLAVGGSDGINPLPPHEARTTDNGDLQDIGVEDAGLDGRLLRGVAPRLLDIDRDGDLDLFVLSRPSLDLSNVIRHAVYENLGTEPNGNGTYQLINYTGIEKSVGQAGFLVTDVDSDGYPDIFILSPGVRFYRGRPKRKFVDKTSCLPLGLRSSGPYGGAVQLDIDNDGDMDILFSGGLRLKTKLLKSGRDVLLENLSENVTDANCGFRYADVTETANLRTDGIRHGITAADFNNDGFIDIFMPEVGPGGARINDTIMLNLGNKSFLGFTDHGANGPLEGDITYPTGAQAFDYDRDGLVDIVVATRYNQGNQSQGYLRLFKNTVENGNNYLIVQVPVSIDGKTTMDALLTVRTGGGSFHRVVGSVGEFRTQSFIDQVHFGLGNNSVVLSIDLKLMEGTLYAFGGCAANQMIPLLSLAMIAPSPSVSPPSSCSPL
uniref:ASPIC/UnbV domain-containing protein n=1 Tax=Compsopogon caeruleus TaxID=31354 RepID=A0A7S1TCJ4_9RHOD